MVLINYFDKHFKLSQYYDFFNSKDLFLVFNILESMVFYDLHIYNYKAIF
jgi:hypothetical protein